MKFDLKPLPYSHDALEPSIDARTVEIHHDKHQAAYTEKLNAALALAPAFDFKGDLTELLSDLSVVPEQIRVAVHNNGGGVWNHEFYWDGLSPERSLPSPNLKVAIEKKFGDFDSFKIQMSEAAISLFGSGWAWLGANVNGELEICRTSNQDSPIMFNPNCEHAEDCACSSECSCSLEPIFTIDVWEHAYYLKYKNLRADYVNFIWDIVNWKRVSDRFERALDNASKFPLRKES